MLFDESEIKYKEDDFKDDSGLRSRRKDLDFLNQSAAVGRNSIHMYPAMFHYLLVRKLIEGYSEKGNLILDPFCGSGVSLLEALRLERNCVGVDINPLAILISRVRCSSLVNNDVQIIRRLLSELDDKWIDLETDIPNVKNIDYWYSENAVIGLGKIRSWISDHIKSELSSVVKRLIVLAFSDTSRYASFVRKNEFKRYRMAQSRISLFKPDIKKVYQLILSDYVSMLAAESIPESNICRLIYEDLREGLSIEDESVDLVVTSPPYGDSRTTVAYDEFSSFSLEWANGLIRSVLTLNDGVVIQNKNELAARLLGSGLTCEPLKSKTLGEIVKKIDETNTKRARDVERFYSDLSIVIKSVSAKLRAGGHACFVVGNRTVAGVPIPMDLIVKEMFEETGMRLREILVRKIGNKRMPSRNSPSNVAGKTVNTMLYEYIVVMQK